jgi:hypothetical protein
MIGLHEVATLRVAPQPFYGIPQRKPQKQHFALLQGVDEFVVLGDLTDPSLVTPAKDDSEDIRGIETAEREKFIIDNFHSAGKDTLFFSFCLGFSYFCRIFASFYIGYFLTEIRRL